jgi:phosphoribosylglycinamide formyltransferase-1
LVDNQGAPPRLGVLASGTGSILAALIADRLPIVVVATDRACGAETVAIGGGVPVERVARHEFGAHFDRPAYSRQLVATLRARRVDVVAMAGFGTVLSGEFVTAFSGRVLNTHPSLLPAFRGWRAVAAALQAGEKETGCTVHLVTEAVDEGPVLAQKRVPILPGDDESTLHERIKSIERVLYPATIRAYLASVDSDSAKQSVAR